MLTVVIRLVVGLALLTALYWLSELGVVSNNALWPCFHSCSGSSRSYGNQMEPAVTRPRYFDIGVVSDSAAPHRIRNGTFTPAAIGMDAFRVANLSQLLHSRIPNTNAGHAATSDCFMQMRLVAYFALLHDRTIKLTCLTRL